MGHFIHIDKFRTSGKHDPCSHRHPQADTMTHNVVMTMRRARAVDFLFLCPHIGTMQSDVPSIIATRYYMDKRVEYAY